MALKIYIAGTALGKTPKEVLKYFKWKQDYLINLGYEVFNPFVGRQTLDEGRAWKPYGCNDVVTRDLYFLNKADVLLAELESTNSPGTCMEIYHAKEVKRIPIIIITKDPKVLDHPWIQYCASLIIDNFEDAVEELRNYVY